MIGSAPLHRQIEPPCGGRARRSLSWSSSRLSRWSSRLLGRRNFGLGTLGNFLLGRPHGSAYLLPEYLLAAQGFNSERSVR
jgi:hypothetical protein